MKSLSPTLLFGLGLLMFQCALDERTLHEANGCGSSSGDSTCNAGSGGSGGASPTANGGSTPATGGVLSEAGAASMAGAPGSVLPPGTTGAPCTADPDCRTVDGGPGRCLQGWPGGYCSSPCTAFPDCAGNDSTLCRSLEGEDRCLVACFGPLDCRENYVCDRELFACVPE
jgi:hypothetical protein